MEDQTKSGKWHQFLQSLNDPWLIVPIILGLLLLIPVFRTTDEYWKVTLTGISTILVSIGITYYGFIISDKSKYNSLMKEVNNMDKEKAVLEKELQVLSKSNIKILKTMSDGIINHCSEQNRRLSQFEKALLSNIADLIKSYEVYHKPDFEGDLSDFIRLSPRIDQEPDVKKKEFLIYERDNYVFLFKQYGLINNMTGSYSLEDATFKSINPEQSNFMGSSTHENVFDQKP